MVTNVECHLATELVLPVRLLRRCLKRCAEESTPRCETRERFFNDVDGSDTLDEFVEGEGSQFWQMGLPQSALVRQSDITQTGSRD